jgi:hypothetical protein
VKSACSSSNCDFASYVSEIKVKGDVKTWWNEGTAPCMGSSQPVIERSIGIFPAG